VEKQLNTKAERNAKQLICLFLLTINGIPIAFNEPIAGNHNDSFELVANFENMISTLRKCNIRLDGLFLKADAGFDTTEFWENCYKNDIIDNIKHNKKNAKNDTSLLDDELYKKRFVIERTNAWLDGFKATIVRFETKSLHWKYLNTIAFCVILHR